MKKYLLSLLILLLFVSCTENNRAGNESCTLLYFDKAHGHSIISVSEVINAESPEASVKAAFKSLSVSPKKNLKPIISQSVKLLNASVENGICRLELSPGYHRLSAASKTIFDACLTKTLCSFSFVDSIVISCENADYKFSENDFITNSPRTYYDTYSVNLYFSSSSSDGLLCDTEQISLVPGTTLEHAVISRLLEGADSDKMKSAIPQGTVLNNVYVSEGICVIDFSEAFITNIGHSKAEEGLALYSVVNTVTELPMINSVKILIDGNEGYGYAYFDLSKPFTNDSDFLD
ncbi:MAG: GerMN domain-containing protein [Oscillospiraceae bacterium]|nr:GerMN domain-containing protein [Oscillospiraceae bacterium]